MSDLERRLRDALHGAAEQPPSGLMEAVRRRHRRFQIRAGASVAAVIAALAIASPAVAGALSHHDAGESGPVPAAGRTSHPTVYSSHHPHPSAAPGTVLVGCGDLPNSGNIGSKAVPGRPDRGLPLRFLPGGHSSGRLRLYVAIAVLKGLHPGTQVVVRVPSAYRGDLRFLYANSLLPGTKYTMRSGAAGVTFVACSTSQETVPMPGVTDYYGAYLVRGARCVPVHVWVAGRLAPAVIRLGACQGH